MPKGPLMEESQLRQLLRAIQMTRDVDIDCSTCLELVPIYVDRELAGVDVAQDMPAMHHHLALCEECREEYEALRDLAELDHGQGLPDTSALLRQLDEPRSEP